MKGPTSLEQLLDRISESTKGRSDVTLDEILEHVGKRSFAPLILLAGIMTLAPVVGDIPGVPTVIALLVFLIAVQLLFGRKYFWLPSFILKRSVSDKKICKALSWLYRPAKFIDHFMKPRLTILTEGRMINVIAFVCLLVSLIMPVMEVVPFSANLAGAALTAFGLAMIAHDGVIALAALSLTAMGAGAVIYSFI